MVKTLPEYEKTNRHHQIPHKVLGRQRLNEKYPLYLATLGDTDDLVQSSFRGKVRQKQKESGLKD